MGHLQPSWSFRISLSLTQEKTADFSIISFLDVPQLAGCLTSVPLMKPSDSEGRVSEGIWSHFSSFAFHLGLSQHRILGKLQSQIKPHSRLPKTLGVSPTVNHLLLKTILQYRICSSSQSWLHIWGAREQQKSGFSTFGMRPQLCYV